MRRCLRDGQRIPQRNMLLSYQVMLIFFSGRDEVPDAVHAHPPISSATPQGASTTDTSYAALGTEVPRLAAGDDFASRRVLEPARSYHARAGIVSAPAICLAARPRRRRA